MLGDLIMRVIDELGITKEKFKVLYDKRQGFDDIFNKNHPAYDKSEAFLTFLKSGSQRLVRENKALIIDIISRGL